ncbi:MAG TPA: hypothetical protein VF222_09190 [Nitrososphaeraceae archaeon]
MNQISIYIANNLNLINTIAIKSNNSRYNTKKYNNNNINQALYLSFNWSSKLGLVLQSWITGAGGGQYGSVGFIVDCPIVFRFL